jgi:hypothetical protein
MMATQEFVVPKSMPMTSPTSVLFHLVIRDETPPPPTTNSGALCCVVALVMEEVKPLRRPNWSAMIYMCLRG